MNKICRTAPANLPTSRYNFASRFGGGALAYHAVAPAAVRIHLTHSCPILRIGMFTLLSELPNVQVSESELAPESIDQHCIVITDYADGLSVMARQAAVAAVARAQVLIVTTRDKECEVRHAVDSGVMGYLLQSCPSEELLRCVRLISQGVAYLGSTVLRSVTDSLGRMALTRRENDVLQLMARGDSNKQIADDLDISLVTVKTHVSHIFQKLHATARTQAVAVAISRGLLADRDDIASMTDIGPVAASGRSCQMLVSTRRMRGAA